MAREHIGRYVLGHPGRKNAFKWIEKARSDIRLADVAAGFACPVIAFRCIELARRALVRFSIETGVLYECAAPERDLSWMTHNDFHRKLRRAEELLAVHICHAELPPHFTRTLCEVDKHLSDAQQFLDPIVEARKRKERSLWRRLGRWLTKVLKRRT